MEQLVWRVQNEKGEGPYWNRDDNLHDLLEIYDLLDDFSHPGPSDDIGVRWKALKAHKMHRRYRFGFESKEQALAWFGGALPDLAEHGYTLQQVHAKEVIKGDHQVAFIPVEKGDKQ